MTNCVTGCPDDAVVSVLCKIFCETRQAGEDFKRQNPGQRFDYSRHANHLAKTKYSDALAKVGKLVPERSFLVSVAKGALGDTARKLYTQAALKQRLLKEAARQAGEKLAKGAAKRAVLKFVPGLNVLSLAWDVYDLASTGVEVYKMVDEYLAKYDTFRIRPDIAEIGPDGEVKKIYDYKFDYPDGGRDRMGLEQRDLYTEKTGQAPVEIDQKTCRCGKA